MNIFARKVSYFFLFSQIFIKKCAFFFRRQSIWLVLDVIDGIIQYYLIFFGCKSHNCLKKFGKVKKNLLICRNFILKIGLTAYYFVGNLIVCKSNCCNTSFYFSFLVMISRVKFLMPFSLILAFGIVSAFTSLHAQTAPSSENAKVVSFSLENSVVNQYLQNANTDYNDGIGRTGISILYYKILGRDNSPYLFEVQETGGLPGWPEQCAPVTLPTVKDGYVLLSEKPTFDNNFIVSAKSTSVSVYNLKPQTIYWYKMYDFNNKQVSAGIFKTQGRLRVIRTEKVLNVRDIGGWKCDGGRLAYGKIFRGAALEGITSEAGPVSDSDIRELTTVIGVGSELDLRNNSTLAASPLGKNVNYKNIDIEHYLYPLENTLPNNKVGSGDYYSKFASLIDYIIGNLKANRGTYIHCKWGADRTGIVIALIEALCGVSEADIVKDWELTSFNAVCYRKYINVQDIKYNYLDTNNKLQSKPSELRASFDYLYENYGGNSGASLQSQVTRWFKEKVFANRSDKGASVINELRSLLITPDVKSPVIIKDLSNEIDSYNYSVTTESTSYFNSVDSKYVVPTTGKIAENDAVTCTDYISCSGYSYLLLNAPTAKIGAFYDANKKYLGSIEDSTVSNNFGNGTVLFDNRQYSIPAKAAYVRLNMPKYCDWTAVLSVTPYL